MAQQKIELRKIRDFGQNFNDTFGFLRQNFKPIITSALAICGLFMMAQAIFNGIFESRSANIFTMLFRTGRGAYDYARYSDSFWIIYFLTVTFNYLTYISLKTLMGAYFKFYLENDGQEPSISQIWDIFRAYFFRVFLYSIPVGILTTLGYFLCLAPGVYLAVVWVPFSMVVMIEDTTFNGAFNRCFEIIKNNFWISLAIYLVSYLIFLFSTVIIKGLTSFLGGIISYFIAEDIGPTVSIITSFLNIFSYIFYIIFFITAALQYFTLVEQRDGTGMLSRIEGIGTDNNRFDNIEEQY